MSLLSVLSRGLRIYTALSFPSHINKVPHFNLFIYLMYTGTPGTADTSRSQRDKRDRKDRTRRKGGETRNGTLPGTQGT